MPEEKKNVRVSIATIGAIFAVLGGPLVVWNNLSAENAKQKEKIEQLEQRAKEDRRDARQSIGEVKEHVKIIDQNTQVILQELRAMKAVQEAERRRLR